MHDSKKRISNIPPGPGERTPHRRQGHATVRRTHHGENTRPVPGGTATAPTVGAFSGSNHRRLVERKHRPLGRMLAHLFQSDRPGERWKQRLARDHRRQPRRRVAALAVMVGLRGMLVRHRRAIGPVQRRLRRITRVAAGIRVRFRPTIVEVRPGRTEAQSGERAENENPLQEPEHRRQQTSRAKSGQGETESSVYARKVFPGGASAFERVGSPDSSPTASPRLA